MKPTFARTRVKFCGMANADDVDAAVALGVDALGFIFAPSPRRLAIDVAARLIARVPPFVQTIAVFADPDDELYRAVAAIMPAMVPQFCGDESPERCTALTRGAYLKVVHVDTASDPQAIAHATARYAHALPVFDTKITGMHGGSGIAFDWNLLPPRPVHGVIAGGLSAANVATCIREALPYGVDVRSGIESGERKDLNKMRAFLAAVRVADEERKQQE